MSHIGEVIEYFRHQKNLTRADLAKDICSEKYIYLIEKEERTPSAKMLIEISDRLNTDLFAYYRYLDCENPIAVMAYINKFSHLRLTYQQKELRELTVSAKELPDFQKAPWSHEILRNESDLLICSGENFEEVLAMIEDFLSSNDEKNLSASTYASLLVSASICLANLGDLSKAEKVLLEAKEKMTDRHLTFQDEIIHSDISISLMYLKYRLGKYEEVVKEAGIMLKNRNKRDFMDRLHFAYFYLALAQNKMDLKQEAIVSIKKGMCLSLINDCNRCYGFMLQTDDIKELVNFSSTKSSITDEFKIKYGFN